MPQLDYGRSIRAPLVRCLILAMTAVAIGPGTAAAQAVVTIDIVSDDFVDPATGLHIDPTIAVGDTVHWEWIGAFHSTTAAAGQADSWDSGVHNPPFSFDHTFLVPGTFNYYCMVHGFDAGGGTVGGMSGTIFVRPVPEPSLVLLAAGLASAGVAGVRRLARKSPAGTCDGPRVPGVRSGGSDD